MTSLVNYISNFVSYIFEGIKLIVTFLFYLFDFVSGYFVVLPVEVVGVISTVFIVSTLIIIWRAIQ